MKTLLSIIPVLACHFYSYGQTAHPRADITLYLKTAVRIDSVFFANLTQDREFQFLPYSDTMRIDLKDSINDLYTFVFYTEKGRVMNQLWLDGKNIVITAEISSKAKVDTVTGSGLYYRSVGFRNEYGQLLDRNADSAAINRFLLAAVKNNIGNPFSIEIANIFFRKNQADQNKLRQLYPLLEGQTHAIRNHGLNPYRIIDKILTRQKIDFNRFHFYDSKGNITALRPAPQTKYLLDFWFIACPPCISDHQRLKNDIKTLSEKNIELVGISTDQDQKEWADFLSKNKHGWRDIRQAGSYQEKLSTDLMINVFPTYILTDHLGNILYRTSSLDEALGYIGNAVN